MAERMFAYAKKPTAIWANAVFGKPQRVKEPPLQAPYAHIMSLQRSIGNQAVMRSLKRGTVDAELRVQSHRPGFSRPHTIAKKGAGTFNIQPLKGRTIQRVSPACRNAANWIILEIVNNSISVQPVTITGSGRIDIVNRDPSLHHLRFLNQSLFSPHELVVFGNQTESVDVGSVGREQRGKLYLETAGPTRIGLPITICP